MAYREEKFHATFEKYDEFLATQDSLVNLDLFEEPNHDLDKKETLSLQKLTSTVCPPSD